ncbi:MAG: membrane protein insertase YidC [Alphaproteobacteria bacterium]
MNSDNRNMLLAVVLSGAILFVWQMFFAPEPPAPIEQSAIERTQNGSGTNLADAPTAPAGAQGLPQPDGTMLPAQGATQSLSREDSLGISPRLQVENHNVTGSISLKGARIDDLTLTGYRETIEEDSPLVSLLSPAGSPNPYLADFGWTAANPGALGLPTKDTMWSLSGNSTLGVDSPVTLTYTAPSGLIFERTISIDDKFLISVTDRVMNQGSTAQTLYPYALVKRTGIPQIEGIYILHEGAYGVFNGELNEVDYDEMLEDGPQKFETTGGWLGFTDKYWMTALVPNQDEIVTAKFSQRQVGGKPVFQSDYIMGARTVAPNSDITVTHRLFAGAKRVDVIDTYNEDEGITRFDLSIDWGWFYFLTKPTFFLLDWFYTHVGNFGIAIILLTLLYKLAFFPLANKSYESMSKMKKVQPELMKLRETHKDNPQAQQQAMMELYKKEKVNPLAGCLPMLIQIPVFFALYKVLFVSIEMRHAPFFGWIQDLSAPDPTSMFNLFGLIPFSPPDFLMIGIWPLAMGISMFAMQKLNPPPTDQMQARIFQLMPIFFTFLLARFASGLVVYWTFNNLLSLAQQYLIMRRMGVAIGGGTVEAENKS